jgi:hypothetical protein
VRLLFVNVQESTTLVLIMVNPDESDTYVVQIFSNFAPPELRPLLVRLERDATVEECIQASLNKFIQRQPILVLPSDIPAEYALSVAGGDGYPAVGSHAFDPRAILRNISALEFPFMVCLTFAPLKEAAVTSMTGSEKQQLQSTAGSDKRVVQHKTLSALEKQALAKEIKQREQAREENLRIIERRRVDREREAYQHCESYEVMRREAVQKEIQEKQRLEIERELKEEEDQMRLEAEAEAASNATKEMTLLEKHRAEMAQAVEAEKRHAQQVIQAKEERLQKSLQEKQRLADERRRQLAGERNVRMVSALDQLIDNLHESIDVSSSVETSRLDRERFDRKDVERMEADLRNIASLEERRHAPKDSERESRFRFLVAREDYERAKVFSAVDEEQNQKSAEAVRFERWMIEEIKRKEAVVAEMELEYRSREGVSSAIVPL